VVEVVLIDPVVLSILLPFDGIVDHMFMISSVPMMNKTKEKRKRSKYQIS
jgi:hypothetical protein